MVMVPEGENARAGARERRPAPVCGNAGMANARLLEVVARGGRTVLFVVVCAFLALFHSEKGYGQAPSQAPEKDSSDAPLLFLGNQALPPMIYKENGEYVGVVVDLAKALKERMERPVVLEYMNWTRAQDLVLRGEADALLQINPSEERREIYDFSDPLLESEFSIFVPSSTEGVYDASGLKGLEVGVEQKGLPMDVLKRYPSIKKVVIPDIPTGLRLLAEGAVDAVVVDRWVGSFVLAENKMGGIRIAGEPIDKSSSAIAVKKGRAALLAEIDAALDDIGKDGTYSKILAKWRPREVVFQTKEQYSKQRIVFAVVLCAFVISIVWGVFLLREIKKRKKVIEDLEKALSEVRTLSGLLPICSICKKIRDDKGYWSQIDVYIQEHSQARFSHGICRECAKEHYPDLDIYDDD